MHKRFPRKLTIPRIKEKRLSNSWSQLETSDVILQAAGSERTITFSGINGIVITGIEGNPDIVLIDGSGVAGITDHGALTGLSDDDHTQYHTDARADTWFLTKSHTNLLDIGTNTHAQIDTHIANNAIHFTEASIDHGSIAGLGDDDHAQYHNDARALTWLGTRSTTDLPEGTNLYYTELRVSANTDVAANTAARHDAVTVADTATVDLTLAGQLVSAAVIPGGLNLQDLSGAVTDGQVPNTITLDNITQITSRSHTALSDIGTNTHAQIDTHIADGTVHFTEGSIDHTAIANIGTNTHAQLDTHVADATIHFTEGSIDHGALAGLGDDDHSQYHTDARGDARYYTETELDAGQLDNQYYTETELNAGQLNNQYYTESEVDTKFTLSGVTNGNAHDHSGGDGAQIDHTTLSNIGSNTHGQIDTHIADGTIHFTTASIDHTDLLNIGTNTHDQIDAHLVSFVTHSGDATIHFTEASIDHGSIAGLADDDHTQYHNDARWDTRFGTSDLTNLGTKSHTVLSDIGTNTHAQLDTHVADATIHFTEGSIDHGSIAGLADDDHTQYHTDARGDARYYTETELDAGQLDNRYYTETELDAGQLNNQYYTEAELDTKFTLSGVTNGNSHDHSGGDGAQIDHTTLSNIGTNTHAQLDTHVADSTVHFTEGSIDHGALVGLGDDDHSQYHTDARALTWLGTRSTTDLAEGTNLYYTTARFDTRFGTSDLNDLATKSHTVLSDIGSNTHPQIDAHLVSFVTHSGDSSIHFTEASIDHTNLLNIGTNTHAQLDTHVGDGTIHFTEGSIDHTALLNIGTNTHAQIDTHIADTTVHFTEGSIDHTAIANIGTNSHDQIDTHLAADHVDSFNGRTGVVLPEDGDYTLSGLSDTTLDVLVSGHNLEWDGFTWKNVTPVAGVTDHGLLSGLADDDHTQYHNDSRWDTRFGTSDLTNLGTKSHTVLSDIGTNTHPQIDTHIADGTVHFTEGSIDHGNLTGLSDDDHTQYSLVDGTRAYTGAVSIEGSANVAQLVIQANATQANTNPLIQMKDSGGTDILALHTDDISNVFIGVAAGQVNVANSPTGVQNTFIGNQAGAANTDGFNNTFIGQNAGLANTTGDKNIFIGTFSGAFNTIGTKNFGLGFRALSRNSSGGSNIGIGEDTLFFNQTGNNNIAIGALSMRGSASESHSFNMGIGGQTLNKITSGANNVAIGFQAQTTLTTGSFNTSIGSRTGELNQTGANNTMIGYFAGKGVGVNSNSDNTFIGFKAGSVATTGSRNILIGYQAGDNISTGTNNIIIGYDLDASSVGVTNELNIGNVFKGDTSTLDAEVANKLLVNDKLTVISEASVSGLAVGTTSIPVGADAIGIMAVHGPALSAAGAPIINFTTDADDFPFLTIGGVGHNAQLMGFEFYVDNSFTLRSSTAGTAGLIDCDSQFFKFAVSSGIAAGEALGAIVPVLALDGWNRRVLIQNENNISGAPGAVLEVRNITFSTTAMVIDQQVNDEPFINFKGNTGANTTASVSTHGTSGTIQGHIQIEINGVKRWIAFTDDPSA